MMVYCRIVFGKPETTEYKGIIYKYYPKWRCGVSLGCYVLLGHIFDESPETTAHEWGHTRQSLIFGPLYLLFIGLPSGLGNLYDRFYHNKAHGWTHAQSYKWYYSQPWEKWADMLGGVERKFEE